MTAEVERGIRPLTLPALRTRSLALQMGLVALAVLLPALAHLWGLPVLILLPMHWPVLLAGLAYGWMGGGLVGALSPWVSFVLSGRPGLPILPAMTVELAVYGVTAGWLREKARWSAWAALGMALVAGRVAYLLVMLLMGRLVNGEFLQATLLPGLPAALLQWAVLPLIAQRWVDAERRHL